MTHTDSNRGVIDKLLEIANLLEQQHSNPFRILAYRKAAATVDHLDEPIDHIVRQQGIAGLLELPNIGEGIARSIYEYVTTGRISRLDALHAGQDPVDVLQQIPGLGPVLANKIHTRLHIDSLEALELAAHNGRLAKIPGLGKRRLESLRAWLTSRFGKRRQGIPMDSLIEEPAVALLLQIDQKYREEAQQDKLPKIAPKRFNPSAQPWLPILHTTDGGWHFTALFSNTQRAHDLGRTNDWVVIYFYDRDHHEGQHTVVTETHGPLIGQRVIRGREKECLIYYEAHQA